MQSYDNIIMILHKLDEKRMNYKKGTCLLHLFFIM